MHAFIVNRKQPEEWGDLPIEKLPWHFIATGKYKYSLGHLLSPFELTFEYIKADYKGFFASYGIELNSSEEWVKKSIPLYLGFIAQI